METPILKLPKVSKAFVLQTDASDVGIGPVLLQYEDGPTGLKSNKDFLVWESRYGEKKIKIRTLKYHILFRTSLLSLYNDHINYCKVIHWSSSCVLAKCSGLHI